MRHGSVPLYRHNLCAVACPIALRRPCLFVPILREQNHKKKNVNAKNKEFQPFPFGFIYRHSVSCLYVYVRLDAFSIQSLNVSLSFHTFSLYQPILSLSTHSFSLYQPILSISINPFYLYQPILSLSTHSISITLFSFSEFSLSLPPNRLFFCLQWRFVTLFSCDRAFIELYSCLICLRV